LLNEYYNSQTVCFTDLNLGFIIVNQLLNQWFSDELCKPSEMPNLRITGFAFRAFIYIFNEWPLKISIENLKKWQSAKYLHACMHTCMHSCRHARMNACIYVWIHVVVVVVYLMSTLSPLQVEEIFWDRLFHQCISHESNAWRKRCVFRPDLKTGKEQGARRWHPSVWHQNEYNSWNELTCTTQLIRWHHFQLCIGAWYLQLGFRVHADITTLISHKY